MVDLANMMWIESRKAIRSRIPLWTGLGSVLMPLGIAFLIFVSRNPEVSRKLGLISAKADLLAYAGTDWAAYLGLSGQIVAAGGFILFVLVISWVFGREFTDGTLKDMLAVPVQRSTILLAKFIVTGLWSSMLTSVILCATLVTGALLQLPGGSAVVVVQGGATVAVVASLTIVAILPFAFFASVGRGVLLPIGVAVLALMMTNLIVIIGWGELFPWAVAGLYAMGESPLPSISYAVVFLAGLAGMVATYLWWKNADQSR